MSKGKVKLGPAEFRVRWVEGREASEELADRMNADFKRRDPGGRFGNYHGIEPGEAQEKRMAQLTRRLKADGFTMSHTDEQGFLVYRREG